MLKWIMPRLEPLNRSPRSPRPTLPASSASFLRLSVLQLLEHYKIMSLNHPHIQHPSASLSRLLALQRLHFLLMKSAHFSEVRAFSTQFQVLGCHYSAQKAILQHVLQQVMYLFCCTCCQWQGTHGQSMGKVIKGSDHYWVATLLVKWQIYCHLPRGNPRCSTLNKCLVRTSLLNGSFPSDVQWASDSLKIKYISQN